MYIHIHIQYMYTVLYTCTCMYNWGLIITKKNFILYYMYMNVVCYIVRSEEREMSYNSKTWSISIKAIHLLNTSKAQHKAKKMKEKQMTRKRDKTILLEVKLRRCRIKWNTLYVFQCHDSLGWTCNAGSISNSRFFIMVMLQLRKSYKISTWRSCSKFNSGWDCKYSSHLPPPLSLTKYRKKSFSPTQFQAKLAINGNCV